MKALAYCTCIFLFFTFAAAGLLALCTGHFAAVPAFCSAIVFMVLALKFEI